jgi:hypothetical protein
MEGVRQNPPVRPGPQPILPVLTQFLLVFFSALGAEGRGGDPFVTAEEAAEVGRVLESQLEADFGHAEFGVEQLALGGEETAEADVFAGGAAGGGADGVVEVVDADAEFARVGRERGPPEEVFFDGELEAADERGGADGLRAAVFSL